MNDAHNPSPTTIAAIEAEARRLRGEAMRDGVAWIGKTLMAAIRSLRTRQTRLHQHS